jgi:predicted RNA-binding protein with PIN domain
MPELVEIEPRYLRSAIEFAVAIAAEAHKRKFSIPYPSELRAQFSSPRIPTKELGRLRRAIEADDTFRSRVAVGVLPELVDEIGALWLQRPANWEADISALIAEREKAEHDAGLDLSLRTSEKRRKAAEQATVRTRAEMVSLTENIEAQKQTIDALRTDVVKADDELAAMRTELIDVRNETRHARDRELSSASKLQNALADLDKIRGQAVESKPDVSDPSEPVTVPSNNHEIAAAVRAAQSLVDKLSALLADDAAATESGDSDRPRREPLALPGGVISSSAEAAMYFARSDAEILIDGYNVAKLGWPRLSLELQRNRLLDAVEDFVRRYGASVTVFFDGASIVGAHTDRRQLTRVVFSAEGVTADDIIRDEVKRIPATGSVVVVTNDAEIVRDVRADGANALPSNALLAVI